MAGAVLLVILGGWLVTQATAGRLGARLLSYRSAPIGSLAPDFTSFPSGAVAPGAAVGALGGSVAAGAIAGSMGLVRPAPGPITQGYGGASHHPGLDIGCSIGTPVVAAAAGTVLRSESPATTGGYGNLVTIRHPSGMETRYAHLSARYVNPGDQVAQGQTIGLSGNTGHSSGPHLHFEVLVNGHTVDPAPYVGAA